MKRLALPLILALAVGCAWGQTEGLITLPYAVPEFPAFKALNITPSADLTPASAQQLATILADNFQGGDSTFPNTLALEIAPMILFKPGFLLEDYLKAAWLYDSGISLASTTTDSLTKASLGLRLCLIDRSRVPGIEALFEAGRTRDVIYSDLEDAFLAEHELEELEDPAVQAMLREECDRLYALQVRDGKRQFSARNWNRMKLQLAVAVVGNSPNALVRDVEFDSAQAWLVFSFDPFQQAEFVLSPSLRHFHAGDYYTDFYLPGKFNWGGNQAKVSLTGQYAYLQKDQSNALTLAMGFYKSITDYLGIEASLGYTRDFNLEAARFDTDFRFKYSLQD